MPKKGNIYPSQGIKINIQSSFIEFFPENDRFFSVQVL